MIFSNIKSVWSNNEREESEIMNTPIYTIKKCTNLFPSWVIETNEAGTYECQYIDQIRIKNTIEDKWYMLFRCENGYTLRVRAN